jgi:hypothetical protein
MRKKTMKLVVTFHTTAQAIGMEKMCAKMNVPGRLIPVPTSISAGCGLAWSTDLADRELIESVMLPEGVKKEDIYECLL